MNSQILEVWRETMIGNQIDVVRFVDVLLAGLNNAKMISAHVYEKTEMVLMVDSRELRLPADAMAGKFRMICARLAVVFGGELKNPPMLYGGSLSAQLPLGTTVVNARLEFSNTAAQHWFRVFVAE